VSRIYGGALTCEKGQLPETGHSNKMLCVRGSSEMKGKISLKEFIHQVKKELVDAQEGIGDPFYELENVELEVSFAIDVKGESKLDLVVIELGAEANAQQLHKVTLSLKPLTKETLSEKPAKSGGGLHSDGIGKQLNSGRRPVYRKEDGPID